MPPRVPTEDLLDDLQRVADKLGEAPSYSQYGKHGNYGQNTIIRRFGSWNEAIKTAGYDINQVRTAESVELLKDIAEVADGDIAPENHTYTNRGEFSNGVVHKHFGTWWRGTVRAGIKPKYRRPLTPQAYDQYFQTVRSFGSPIRSLPILLCMFTGMTRDVIMNMKYDWLRQKRDKNIVRVPPEFTDSNRAWVLRMPETWYNPYTQKRMKTRLPQTVEWVLNEQKYEKLPLSSTRELYTECLKTAQSADIEQRQSKKYKNNHLESTEAPVVRPSDLSYSYGVNLARQGVDLEVIKRQLGTDGFQSEYKIEDLLLWCYVREGYEHPDYQPSGTYFDPDSGDVREIKSEAD